ncbi:DMT family transporter [Pseudomonas citri]|uniref:DMT family transporter n=1 Tax=Pseudomonas citri TaxID=2978349 RepID=UPI0021B6053E|nr:DMT family transporter [Pseudomonas citri]
MNAATQPLTEHGTRTGILLILLSMFVFAAQDGITKTLVENLPISQLIMVRYWFFLLFGVLYTSLNGGLKNSIKSQHPTLQISRSILGIVEITIFGLALKFLGLAETHAIYAIFPLITIAMAGVFLREKITGLQLIAGLIGFTGTLIILRPGLGVFSAAAGIPLIAALMFASFSILSRKIGSDDSFGTNMLYMGLGGAITSSLLGLPQWVTPTATQSLMMMVLSMTGIIAQMLLIQALKYAPAVTLQPFNYSLLVFASLIGVFWFQEKVDLFLVAGAALVVAGGLLSFKMTGKP